jgi:general secretion pathway protein D
VSGSTKRGVLVLVSALLMSSCAVQRLHQQGNDEIDHGEYEKGLSDLEHAVRLDPRNVDYRIEYQVRHDDVVVKLLGQAERSRAAGKFDEAEQAYRRVLVIEHGNDRAQRGLDGIAADRRHGAMMARAEDELKRGQLDQSASSIRAILTEDPGFPPALALQAKIDAARGPISVTPHLKTRENRPVTLEFRDANTKMVFEVLSRQTGVNFVFDKDVKSDGKTTIYVQQVPVEQAIDLVIGQNQLARQVLSDNMVLIYPNTPIKQKEYQDEIVKTFYLTNADPKKAQDLLKTVLNAKTLYVDDKANMIVMRDTPEAVRMAEKLVTSLDLADPEVMLEVEVLEISRSNLTQLGIEYPTTATLSTPSNLTLQSISHLRQSDISVTPLSLTVDLLKQVGRANTLASPRIRARNREKAKILIGSREPVITNSVTPTAGGTGVVTGSVQYLDVGLTLEVEPTVHLDNEVSIKMNMEVSSITKQVTTASGTVAYEIGTRNAQTLLSLRDGETQILAGLIQDSDTRTSNRVPGLGDIPLLGKLFGSDRIDKEKSEIVLSITPRIIRSSARPPSETTEFWYGTESNLRSAPLGSVSDAPAPASAADSGSAQPAPPATPPQRPAVGGIALDPLLAPASVAVAPAAAPPIAAPAAVSAEQAVQAPTAQATAMPQAPDVPTPTVQTPIVAAPSVAAPAVVAAPGGVTEPGGVAGPAVVAAPMVAAAPAPANAAPAARPTGQAEPSPAGVELSWAGASKASVGRTFDVTVKLSSPSGLTRISSQLHFDGSVLELESVDAGPLVPPALQAAATSRSNQRAGVVQYVVVGNKDSLVQGEGDFLILHFKPLKPSASSPITLQFVAAGSDGRNVRAAVPAPLALTVGK